MKNTFSRFLFVLVIGIFYLFISKNYLGENISEKNIQKIAEEVVEKTEEINKPPKLNLSEFDNEFPREFPDETKENIVLMPSNYIFPNFPITAQGVAKESKLIKVDGKLKSATLNISASADRHSAVYFYIDSGSKGGLIDVNRNKNESRIISGGFKYQEDYKKSFDLKSLNVSNKHQGNIEIPILDILNDNKWHYFIAFVNSDGGILKEFSIDYECASVCELKIKNP